MCGDEATPLRFQERLELRPRGGVDDVLSPKPAFAGDVDAEAEVVEVVFVMGIGSDDAFDAEVAGVMPPAPVKIESRRGGVEFNPSAGLSGCLENFGDIEGVGGTLKKETTGGVPDASDVGVFDGAEDATRHGFFIMGECGVD